MLDIFWLTLPTALAGGSLVGVLTVGLLSRRHGAERAAMAEALRAAQAEADEWRLLHETDTAAQRTRDRDLRQERARTLDADGRHRVESVGLAFGPCRIRVFATPIEDEQGRHAGDLLLWIDKTDESRIERSIAEVLEAIAQGDLTARTPATGQKEFLDTATTGINEIVARLARLVAAVTESTKALRDEATGMADRSAQIATRVETAAASLERTASRLRQISQAVRQSAGSATTASEIAERTCTEASEGRAPASQSGQTLERVVGSFSEAVAQLDLLTRDMSGFADESQLASGQMVAQADALAEFLQRYRTDDPDGAAHSQRADQSRPHGLLEQPRIGLRQR